MYRIRITRSYLSFHLWLVKMDGLTSFLTGVLICNEALRTLFGIDCYGMMTLVQHMIHHTQPIHHLTGRAPEVTTKFQENIMSQLAYFLRINSF